MHGNKNHLQGFLRIDSDPEKTLQMIFFLGGSPSYGAVWVRR